MTTTLTAKSAPSGAADARRASEHSGWLTVVGFAWVLIWGALLMMNLGSIGAREFHDPDDELRLQQVRDLIAGQGWFDLHQYRIDAAGGGVPMHWSRLIDGPIAAVVLVLRPLLGSTGAEQVAVLAIPALTLFAILALIGWMAARTLAPSERIFAVLAVAFAAPVMVQVLPLRIDHHGWQIALALAAVAAFLDSNERRGGALSGAALAAWMAISFEGLPFAAWFVAVLALWSLLDRTMRPRLAATMLSLAGTSAALFLATRGVGDLINHCDTIAPIHLGMFAWGAAAIGVPVLLAPGSRIALAAGLAAAAAGALGLVFAVAPQCTSGSFDMLDPVVRSFWYDNVQEGKSIFVTQWHLIAQYALPPLLGLHAAIVLARRAQGPMQRWWVFYALILAGALAIGFAVARAASISGALSALPLGWRLASWMAALKRPSNPLLRAGELAGVAALIFAALLPVVPVMAIESLFSDAIAKGVDKDISLACSVGKAGAALDALPAGDILAPLDFGPNILLNSNKGVLATGHHRGAKSMRLVIDAFTGTPDRARAIMRAKGLRYLLICPKVSEMDLYRDRAPTGFAAQLLDGRVPAWLRPVPLPAASGLRMWALAE